MKLSKPLATKQPPETKLKFSFLSMYKFLLPISIAAIIYGLVLFCSSGLSYGTDFRGGLEKQFFLDKSVQVGDLKEELSSRGIINAEIEKVISRKDVYIARIASGEDAENTKVEAIFADFIEEYGGPDAEIDQTRLVSGVISSENKNNAFWTALVVVGFIVGYLTLRFQFQFAVSAMFAVLHDVLIMLAVTLFVGVEVNILTIVAILTVFGYSVNDTIILFDRVRELQQAELAPSLKTNFGLMEKAVRMIFSRTVITSLTTLFVVTSLFVATVGEYKDFAFLLIVGLISGTYSSIYVALPSAHFFSWVKQRLFKKYRKTA